MTRFQVDVSPDFAPEFEKTAPEALFWQLHGWTAVQGIHGLWLARYTVEAANAPARAEGKLINPTFQRDEDGEVSVIDWGIAAEETTE